MEYRMNGIRTKSSSRPHSLDAGFSFVELMVVIVIIVIVATLALMQRGSANEQFQRQNVARELKVALERARFDSVKRRTNCDQRARVVTTTNSFTLVTDKNQDGDVSDAGDSVVTNLPAGIVIDVSTTINFNMRGEATSPTSQVIRVCNISCNSPTAANSDLLIVTPTGTVNLLSGNESPPTFGVPGGTAVSSTTGINDRLHLSTGAPAVCSP
jgi:prepilin-type N-terminal cleavage/methylation domain-containing protein